ncbi:MAG: 4'-phosphopantetheinyl transferase family protein [Gemmatimonadaceae bacterium]
MLPRQPECAAIDLWLASLDGGDIAARKRVLAPDELARADRFLNTTAAQHYVAARATLREILGRYLKCDPHDVQLEYGEFGKPALVAGNHTSDLHFNVSHACGHAVYAVCTTAEVGVDIECDDGRIDPPGLAPTICSANELRQVQGRPAAEQRELFFRLWTRKEAYLKCLGHGLNTEPSSIEMPMGNVPEVYAGIDDLRCSIRTLKPAPGFQVSLAVRSPRSQVQGFRWWPSETPILE